MKIDMPPPISTNLSVNKVETANQNFDKVKSPSQKEKSTVDTSKNIQSSPVVDSVTINLSLPKQTVDTLERLGNLNDILSNVATNLRATEEGLRTANSTIEQMKSELAKIVKNFPPFGMDSQERKDILMSYSAIQKEIVKMMVPPPPQPLYERVKHIWQDIFSYDGNQSISTPVVPVDAPDSHVKSALQKISGTHAQIEAVRSELGNSLLSSSESK
jgi:hypothetical protein